MDPSNSRTRAGALTEEQLIAGIRDYDADFIALWTGKLSGGRNDMDHRRLQLLIVRETLVKHGVRAAWESE